MAAWTPMASSSGTGSSLRIIAACAIGTASCLPTTSPRAAFGATTAATTTFVPARTGAAPTRARTEGAAYLVGDRPDRRRNHHSCAAAALGLPRDARMGAAGRTGFGHRLGGGRPNFVFGPP